jgi:hypothetical protein
MNPSPRSRAAQVLVPMALLLACPSLLTGQSDKKNNPPPSPPLQQKSAPAPAPQQRQPQAQQHPQQQPHPQRQQPQHSGQPGTTNPVRGAGGGNPGTGAANAGEGTGAGNIRGHGNTGEGTGAAATNVKPPATFKPPVGGRIVPTPAGHTLAQDKNGKVTGVFTKSGTEAHFTPAGKISTIRTTTATTTGTTTTTITHASNGTRTIETMRQTPGGASYRVVSSGTRGGHVERSFSRDGHEYVRRTYVYGNRTYVTVYRTYYYGGRSYYYYVPAYYYAPVYYGWVYNPWPAPVYYTWGWGPWYGPYGYYFAPYLAYPSAAFWLTDYLIAENLRAAYEAQASANAAANAETSQPEARSGTVTLSPEVKQMIAEEVKAQLAAEQAAAQTSTASPTSTPQQPAPNSEQALPALDPNLRVFIVTTRLDVSAGDQACSLGPGDVLMRTENTPDSANTVGVNVVSSQKSDCRMGSSPRVQVADLQEMHNHFREQLDSGLKTLADNQGKNGIPSGPAAGGRSNREGAAAPDLSVTADLQKQQEEADQAEKEVQQASAPSTGRS